MDCSKDLKWVIDEGDSISSTSKKAQESKDGQLKIILQNNLQR